MTPQKFRRTGPRKTLGIFPSILDRDHALHITCYILCDYYDSYVLLYDICVYVDLIVQLVDPTDFLVPVNFVPGPDSYEI